MLSYVMFAIWITILIFLFYVLNKIQLKENFESEEQEICYDESTGTERTKTENEKKEEKSNKSIDDELNDDPNDKREVFHIYNRYNYLNAKEICKLYNGRLATEMDLLKAFQKGANWCHWGWIEGEKIAYPVQEEYWMKTEKKHKGFCGPTAGINKIDNIDPFKKFGINCYGIKPQKDDNDIIEKEPKTLSKCSFSSQEQQERENKKEQELKNMSIMSFNKILWSVLGINNSTNIETKVINTKEKTQKEYEDY